MALPAGLFGLGLIVRVLPLVQGTGMLIRQPSEDGYLLLTVARNIALGHGMSTAAGTMPTNGVQPLITMFDAACFFVAGGDKTRGVALVMALSVVISVLSFFAMLSLGRVLFRQSPDGRRLAALGAGLWFVSPIVVGHSTNALETGLYFLTLAIAIRYFLLHAADPEQDLPWGKAAVLGLLLGLAFWARNDAIFLGLAIAGARVATSLGRPAVVIRRRLLEVVLAGSVMAVVGSPWTIHNQLRFGSVIPISGKAEAAGKLGENLPSLPAKLAETATVVGGIPRKLEGRPAVQLGCLAIVLLAIGVTWTAFRRGATPVRAAAALGLAHAALLATYYGVFFGAGHFLSRYLSPPRCWPRSSR